VLSVISSICLSLYSLSSSLFVEDKRAVFLNGGVGIGKTYILGEVQLRYIKHQVHKCMIDKGVYPTCVYPIFYITKASVIPQMDRVFKNFGLSALTDYNLLNYDQLRATYGGMYIDKILRIEYGREYEEFVWKPIHPYLFIWDEGQAVKNEASKQSLVAQAANNLTHPMIRHIYSSATLFTKVGEAKCFAVAAQPLIDSKRRLSNATWPSFSRQVASPADPWENSPAAVERLMEYLLPYVVDVKGVRPQFHPQNNIKMIDFLSEESFKRYTKAWDVWLDQSAKYAKLKGEGKPVGIMMLVQFNKFREAAEFEKAEPTVDAMFEAVRNGQAAVMATNFKRTIAKAVQILHTKYKVPRSKISIIWGGSDQFNLKKTERLSAAQIQAMILDMSMGKTIDPTIMKKFVFQVKNDDAGFGTDLDGLNLGNQSLKERQREIDNFQSGKTDYCFFTFKSGGVGLSLHHTDEMTEFKCRRKESGYVFEEDIPHVPTKQRIVFLTPTYSAIEMVQGLGRVPRLTSLSATQQLIMFYRGTIEERVAQIVSIKLKCLKKVVRQKEHWEGAIINPDREDEDYNTKQIIDVTDNEVEDEDDPSIEGVFLDEDEENGDTLKPADKPLTIEVEATLVEEKENEIQELVDTTNCSWYFSLYLCLSCFKYKIFFCNALHSFSNSLI